MLIWQQNTVFKNKCLKLLDKCYVTYPLNTRQFQPRIETYKMSGVGDVPSEDNSKNKNELLAERSTEDSEIRSLKVQRQHYKKNLLTNAQKSFIFLEHLSLVGLVEADREYIVSAGRDHEINIWDAVEGRHIRRLSGHSAPVTGLALLKSGEAPFEKIIVSSSEDGSLRQWSLHKGLEFFKVDTGHVITCMGIMNKLLAVTGNNRGYMEIRHLITGELYSTIFAHFDPIDAIVVDGSYICSATFESPSCLKVWDIKYEQTVCIYRIDNSIDFCCIDIWHTTVILGVPNNEKLHVVNFVSGKTKSIDLERSGGKVQQVRVWNEWILSCSIHTGMVFLDVHRIHNYEHFGTFSCKMQQVFAIAAMEFDNSLKIVLGGSALAILTFDFVLTQEIMPVPFNRSNMTGDKTDFMQNKKLTRYTMKSTAVEESHEGNLFDPAKSNSEDEEPSSVPAAMKQLTILQPDSNEINCKSSRIDNENSEINTIPGLSILTKNVQAASTIKTNPQTMYKKTQMLSQCSVEPRIVVKKLEELLDKTQQPEELLTGIKNECATIKDETLGAVRDDIQNASGRDVNNYFIFEEIHAQETGNTHTKPTDESIKHGLNSLTIKERELNSEIKDEQIVEETNLKCRKKCSTKKRRKDKKKELQKSKQKKCEIM